MPTARPSVADKRRQFHELHAAGCFVIPNPWDVGSALYLQHLGFKALASTSSGLAWSLGRADNAITRDMALTHLGALGVRRISVGGALAKCAWGGFVNAATSLAAGKFDALSAGAGAGNLDGLFAGIKRS